MVLKNIMGIVAITMIIGTGSLAATGVPDLNLSTASRAYTGPETAVMFNLPNGGGSSFNTAATIGGTVDATITLYLRDLTASPIANYPLEDLWIESADGGMTACLGGTTADSHTDVLGMTTWAAPLQAGGFSQALTVVMVSGSPLTSGPGLAISYNSADINGDHMVNLTDVQQFASAYFIGRYFRFDFFYDGTLNLSDVAFLGSSIGSSCP